MNSIATHSKYNSCVTGFGFVGPISIREQTLNLIEKTGEVDRTMCRTYVRISKTVDNLTNLFELVRKFGRKNTINGGDRFILLVQSNN